MAPPNGPSSTYGRPLQIVAAATQPAEWVVLYTYTSSAALYSQSPICEVALAPISARAAGIARMSRYARDVRSPVPCGCGLLRPGAVTTGPRSAVLCFRLIAWVPGARAGSYRSWRATCGRYRRHLDRSGAYSDGAVPDSRRPARPPPAGTAGRA